MIKATDSTRDPHPRNLRGWTRMHSGVDESGARIESWVNTEFLRFAEHLGDRTLVPSVNFDELGCRFPGDSLRYLTAMSLQRIR